LRELLPFIVAGLVTGSVYGLTATGLVLSYRTSAIFNLGHGALATVAAYVFYFLRYQHHLNWAIAFALSVFVCGGVMGLGMERLTRSLARESAALQIVGTVGLVLIAEGLGTVLYGSDTRLVGQFLPTGNASFRVGGVNVLYSQLIVTLVALFAAVTLALFLRHTPSGVAMRAVVANPELLAMQGVSSRFVRRQAWLISSIFAATSGVLILPFIGLSATALTLLVVQAFGAAAIGRFESIPLTFVGGLVLGVAASLATKYVVSVAWLAGVPDSLPFIFLFIVLFVLRRTKRRREDVVARTTALPWQAPPRIRGIAGLAILAVLAFLPYLVGPGKLGYLTVGLTQAILILSLGLLVRMSGQVSLCQAAFAAIGAVAFAQLTTHLGIPWFLALFLASLVVVPVAAFIAIPAVRLSSLFLALASLGFGLLVQQLFYTSGFMFTNQENGRMIPRPTFATSDLGFYFVVLAILTVSSVLVMGIGASRLGRMCRGMADAPVAIATLGLNLTITRILMFSISGFLAGMAGILYGASVHFAVSGDPTYQPLNSLTLLAILTLAPFAEPWYAIVAGVSAVIPGYWTGGNSTYWLEVIFGASAIVLALRGGQPGMPRWLQEAISRLPGARGRRAGENHPVEPAAALEMTGPRTIRVVTDRPLADVTDTKGLGVHELTVRYGALTAVSGLTLEAPRGRITGLIGPNGAGKTTVFDVCSGLNNDFSGRITLAGEDVSRLGPAARGRRGLGRTFQRMELADSLTVYQNVALGREAGMAGASVSRQLLARPSEVKITRRVATEALELCGLNGLASAQVGTLSTGRRRLVELARCLAGPFDILLLDEPSSGLDEVETRQFADVLQRVVRERQSGILLVEHDMRLVMEICEYIYVLNFGVLLYEGDREAVAASPQVQEAYLGATSVERFEDLETVVEGDAQESRR
jgi:ABC-type branched-subunit amino acid transport system ATPase component/branched-subunit amino acid ABC-type transport system permease component